MPVFRPTASCIWNSFRSSGKRHIILTGSRGIGKTTLLAKLFPTPQPGITTWAEPGKAVWLRDNRSGQQVQVGIYHPSLPGSSNKMVSCPDGFTALGIPALEQSAHAPWVTIDEIGYLETGCTDYCNAIRRLLRQTQVAAVVRKQDTPFLREIIHRDDVFLVDLDAPYGNLGCVIMASGLGRRFGGNKLMADFLGEPMLLRALSATDGIFRHRVVVTRHKDVAALCRARDTKVVLHDLPARSDTVRLGLAAVGTVDGCLFCPGDQPLLRQETVAALALAAVNDSSSIWRPSNGEAPGAPVLFPGWCFPSLQNLPMGKGGGYVIRQYPQRLRTISTANPWELVDADTPEALSTLLTHAPANFN